MIETGVGMSLVSFLGGSAFRMLWGEISSYIQQKQSHKQEMERMALQEQMDAAAHERNLAAVRLKADLGIREIEVQGAVNLQSLDAEIFGKAVEGVDKLSGVAWVDAWNKAIRPALATQMMLLIFLHSLEAGWTMEDRAWQLAGAVLGVFVADRSLFRRGK